MAVTFQPTLHFWNNLIYDKRLKLQQCGHDWLLIKKGQTHKHANTHTDIETTRLNRPWADSLKNILFVLNSVFIPSSLNVVGILLLTSWPPPLTLYRASWIINRPGVAGAVLQSPSRVCLKSIREPDSRHPRTLGGGLASNIWRIFVLG